MLKTQSSINLVVAAYQENLDWIKQVNHPTIIYNKNDQPINTTNAKVVQLANIGRESHSYLHHITTNYDSLADITIFSQGNPFKHCPHFIEIANCCNIQQMNDLAKKYNKRNWPKSNEDFCMMGCYYCVNYKSVTSNELIIPQENIDLWTELTKWMIDTNTKLPPKTLVVSEGAIFVISKQNLLKFSIEKYKQLYAFHHKYKYTPWFMEAFWYHMFNDCEENFPKLFPYRHRLNNPTYFHI